MDTWPYHWQEEEWLWQNEVVLYPVLHQGGWSPPYLPISPSLFCPHLLFTYTKKKKIHKKILNHPHCQCVLGNISNAILMKIYFIIVTVHLGRVGAYSLKSQACRGRFLLQLLLLCLGQWGTQNLAWKSQKESSQTRYSTTLRVLVRQQGVC